MLLPTDFELTIEDRFELETMKRGLDEAQPTVEDIEKLKDMVLTLVEQNMVFRRIMKRQPDLFI